MERCVEQSTSVHELGHAVGLVDNGLAMKDYVVSGSSILFDAACLADVDAIIAASGT